jgi:hypothetical protein
MIYLLNVQHRRRLPIDHELRQRSGRIDGDVLTSHAGGSNFQPISLQSFLKAFSVRLRSYNDAGIPCPQAGADEFAHRVYQDTAVKRLASAYNRPRSTTQRLCAMTR